MHPQIKRLSLCVVVAALGAGATLLAVRARAAGIPDAAAFTYTGYLEDADGTPLPGPRAIAVELWSDVQAGKKLCEQSSDSVALQAGRFQITLPSQCVDAVAANPNLWADVKVDGVSLGRTKLGAVPYAVEATHATSAAVADAAAASGSLHDAVDGAATTSKFVADRLGPTADPAVDARWGLVHAAAVGACAALSPVSPGPNSGAAYVLPEGMTCDAFCAGTAIKTCRGTVAIGGITSDRLTPSTSIGSHYIYSCGNSVASIREKVGRSPDDGVFSYCCCSGP